MSNLDIFINKAISEVRDSRKKGKAGRNARKSINQSQSKLDEMKAEIQRIARACEKSAWKNTRLLLVKTVCKCKNCGEESPACTEAIYLEQVHKKLGKVQKLLEEIQVDSYPELPREIEERNGTPYLCADCFISYTPNQHEFIFSNPLDQIDHLRYFRKTKRYKLFQEESARWTKMCWDKLLPKYPLLTHNTDGVQSNANV